jgi:hypothetical protein
MDFIKNNFKKVLIGGLIFMIILLLILAPILRKRVTAKKTQEEAQKQEQVEKEKQKDTGVTNSGTGTDKYLMQIQDRLKARFGEAPKGYIRNQDGTLQSLGDKDKSSEDVLYAYLRSLSILDFSTVQKYTRKSSVVKTYNEFFDSKNSSNDYKDAFIRKMYKETLLSIEVKGVEDQAIFASNKIVYTVKLKILDLTNKDFWLEDREEIFKNLMAIDEEGDTTKSEQYIYDYVINKYSKSKDKLTREVRLDLTLEKFADLGSGWLVSIDKELDDNFKYKDGKLFTTYVLEQFRNFRTEKRSGGN